MRESPAGFTMSNVWGTLGASAAIVTGTDLNSLADGSGALGGSPIASPNTSFYGRIELYLASVDFSALDNPAGYVYFLKSNDSGTTYEDGGASTEPARMPDVIIPLREISGAQRVMIDCEVPAGYAKALFFNHAGAALAASGNTLEIALYTTVSS